MQENCRRIFQGQKAKLVLPVDWNEASVGEPGPHTLTRMLDLLRGAATIFWNGRLGETATPLLVRELATLSEKGKAVIVCGKQTVRAVRRFGGTEGITHLSSGDEAALEFIERMTVPGISCLDPRPQRRSILSSSIKP